MVIAIEMCGYMQDIDSSGAKKPVGSPYETSKQRLGFFVMKRYNLQRL